MSSALGLDASSYRSHSLHVGDRAWLETNCYVDLWIEVPHALGLDPVPSLSFTFGADFEGDQWLFYKQATSDLYDLYGIDVEELAIFRPVHEHAELQASRGRVVLVEVDAFDLPDTRGVSYRTAHAKTTIGIESIDVAALRLGYFHNAGYFSLEGDDFRRLFGLDRPFDPAALPPYTEFAKFDRLRRLSRPELARISLAQLKRHLERAPTDNPFERFAVHFRQDLEALMGKGPEAFHQYAFATLRQCGSCFELAATYLRWLEEGGEADLSGHATALESIANSSRGLQMRAARAAMLRRPVDVEPALASMIEAWASVLGPLRARYAG